MEKCVVHTGRTCGNARCSASTVGWDVPLQRTRPETRGSHWASVAAPSSRWHAGDQVPEGQEQDRSTGPRMRQTGGRE